MAPMIMAENEGVAVPGKAAAQGVFLPGATHERLADFQTRLHNALRALASGAMVRPASVSRGWRRAACHPVWAARLGEIDILRRQLQGQAAGALPPRASAPTLADAAVVLAHGYAALRDAIGYRPGLPTASVVGARPLAAKQDGRSALAPIHELRAFLAATCGDNLRAAYVHGSYSTGDFNAYSDLDTLVVLRAEAATDAQRLLDSAVQLVRSCRYLLRCDLLQHHGHFVLTEIDFAWYCDAHFPGVLFASATEIIGDGSLAIYRQRDSSAEARQQLRDMCGRFLDAQRGARLRSAYELKLFLSCFMILPSLLLQVQGQPCYKRESFERVRALYAPEVYAVMDEVSELRRRWRQTPADNWARLGALHPLVRSALFNRQGRWGVPAEIFAIVSHSGFRQRMRDFALATLALASEASRAA